MFRLAKLTFLVGAFLLAVRVWADDVDLEIVEDFVTHYHEKPAPHRVPIVLTTLIQKKVLEHPRFTNDSLSTRLAVAQAFGHMARGNAELVRHYESKLSKANHAEREFVLDALRICGDETTIDKLEQWSTDPAFKNEKATVDSVLAFVANPKRKLPRDKAPQTPPDLDLLWADFFVTGEFAPVAKILDVLERPSDLRRPIESALAKKLDLDTLLPLLRNLDLLAPGSKDQLVAGDVEGRLLFDVRGRFLKGRVDLVTLIGARTFNISADQLEKGWLLQAAAGWSLKSNFEQHSILERRLKEHVHERPTKTRELLKKWLRLDIPANFSKELQPLQGTWKIIHSESEGVITKNPTTPMDDRFKTHRMTFHGSEMTLTVPKTFGEKTIGAVEMIMVVSVEAAKLPGSMTWKLVDSSIGAPPEKDRSIQRMLFEIDGDTLRLCWPKEGVDGFPEEFSAAKGSGQSIMTLKRLSN